MKHIKRLFIFLLFCIVLNGCAHSPPPDTLPPSTEASVPVKSTPASTPEETSGPTPAPPLVPEHEVELVAKTLRGECYDNQHDDKREVVKVICNRVSINRGPDGERFGDSIEAIITAPRQFHGYRESNVPTANDYEIAREVLTEWYENGCQPLGKYLFFSAGNNHKNVFREKFKEDFEQ